MLEKRSKEETEHAEKLAKFQLERDGTIWSGRPLSNIDGCHATPTIECALNKMIEVESQITSTLLEISNYASNGDMGLPSDDTFPDRDILINQSNCQAPHIEDFIVAHYLTEQREVRSRFFPLG